ncbi:MAG: hypothetical protein WBW67_18960, partial [Pseudolabrys sp.]
IADAAGASIILILSEKRIALEGGAEALYRGHRGMSANDAVDGAGSEASKCYRRHMSRYFHLCPAQR